jgi:pimeloyl-[acyl-carrier protein] methyl ester esterase
MTTLVLLPGMDGTGELFHPLLQALGSNQPVLVVTYPTTELLGYVELEAMVRALLPTGPYVLLGESFSGPIAISIAATSPPGLTGLILSCSFASSPRALATAAAPALSLPLPMPPSLAVAAALLGRFANPGRRSMLKQSLAKVSASVLRHRLAAALRVNVFAKLQQLKVPVLYIQASQDWLVPPSAAKAIVSALPSTQVTRVNGPHLLLQVNPAESAGAIRSFIANVANAA